MDKSSTSLRRSRSCRSSGDAPQGGQWGAGLVTWRIAPSLAHEVKPLAALGQNLQHLKRVEVSNPREFGDGSRRKLSELSHDDRGSIPVGECLVDETEAQPVGT